MGQRESKTVEALFDNSLQASEDLVTYLHSALANFEQFQSHLQDLANQVAAIPEGLQAIRSGPVAPTVRPEAAAPPARPGDALARWWADAVRQLNRHAFSQLAPQSGNQPQRRPEDQLPAKRMGDLIEKLTALEDGGRELLDALAQELSESEHRQYAREVKGLRDQRRRLSTRFRWFLKGELEWEGWDGEISAVLPPPAFKPSGGAPGPTAVQVDLTAFAAALASLMQDEMVRVMETCQPVQSLDQLWKEVEELITAILKVKRSVLDLSEQHGEAVSGHVETFVRQIVSSLRSAGVTTTEPKIGNPPMDNWEKHTANWGTSPSGTVAKVMRDGFEISDAERKVLPNVGVQS